MTIYIYIDHHCYIIDVKDTLEPNEIAILKDILYSNTSPHNRNCIITSNRIVNYKNKIEIGPLMNFKSPWCTNAVSILHKCGLTNIISIEKTRFVDKGNEIYDKMTECVYNEFNERVRNYAKNQDYYLPIENLHKYNQRYHYGFDKYDIAYYKKLFNKYQRNPTNVELFDLAQSNSEHSRHWTFISNLYTTNNGNNKKIEHTLFELIKSTLTKENKTNSILAFCDNSSAIHGFNIKHLIEYDGIYKLNEDILHPVLTAETHNFPTGIAPFPGAATGIGGRLRDNVAVGRGGLIIAGTAGYSVGNLLLSNYKQPWEKNTNAVQSSFRSAKEILIEASNGASDYGNKFGEPIILGFTRTFEMSIEAVCIRKDIGHYLIKIDNKEQKIGYIKPIMFTAGIGQMVDTHKYKEPLEFGYLIVRVGGPVYKIGMGGGTASSRNQAEKNMNIDMSAVQRGDPEMENKVYKFIRSCIELGDKNPIISIHDQGAGGMANVTKELVEPNGAVVCLNNVLLGDHTLSNNEIWSSEHQEQVSIIIHPKDSYLIKKIAKRENVPICFFGYITDSGKIEVYDKDNPVTNYPVTLDLKDITSSKINKSYYLYEEEKRQTKPLIMLYSHNFKNSLYNVLRLPSVGSKRFLTNKVDRSVSGLIVQQQCVGPFHTPLSNVAVVANSHFECKGIASSIGEQPLKGLIDYGSMVRLTTAEMLTNLMWAEITDFHDIKCSGNWMWALKGNQEEYYHLYVAVKELTTFLKELGIAIDGGKDSLSMSVKDKQCTIKSPNTLVLSSYVACPNILNVITPDLKEENSILLYINLSDGLYRLGGSAFCQTKKSIGDICPDIRNAQLLKDVFIFIQCLIKEGKIVSGHDVSDGGLITTLIEMSIAGNIGCDIYCDQLYKQEKNKNITHIHYLFSEEIGVVIEVKENHLTYIEDCLNKIDNVIYYSIGRTNSEKVVRIYDNYNKIFFNEKLSDVRYIWEETSYHLELLQANPICVEQERYSMKFQKNPIIRLNDKVIDICQHFNERVLSLHSVLYEYQMNKPKVAIVRDEGSNGEREMAAAFYLAGFEVLDVTMNDLIHHIDKRILSTVRGIAFVGGFTYSDVFGAGVGWYSVIKNNKKLYKQFQDFYHRKDTFSLGVCNGCQLMSHLKWIPGNCRFVKNTSQRFESRFSSVKIRKSPAIMLKDMEGCVMGVWVAHGEGRCVIEEDIHHMRNYTPIQYIDNDFNTTEVYPFNPNGSKKGITAVCSKDGRHLAMMPHPERCFMNWQLPWTPKYYPLRKDGTSAWSMLFYNAYQWCIENNE